MTRIVRDVEVLSTDDPTMKARRLVQYQYNVHGIGTPRGQKIDRLLLEEILVVWFSYTLENWKCILTTTRDGGRIYEVTFKRENDGSDGPAAFFIDTYLKTHSITYAPEEAP